ncbi:MAG: hypothetical protein EON49_16565 [Acidovorax sp.]|nr:MAG: hypothetical protein EON49_16565 [Acidovorax sp.]
MSGGTLAHDVLVCDSVTRMGPGVRGHVAVAASHGGVFAVHLALTEGVTGLVVCDAGVGLERAGIAGLHYADSLGVPCAAIHHRSARIGDGADCAARGLISFANARAVALGVRVGMPAMEAARCMAAADLQAVDPGPSPGESRKVLPGTHGHRTVVLIDSASLVAEEDAESVVITASHGGLLGGRFETAIKLPVFAALYNDAGVGCDGAGVSRLPALDARSIPAATVAASSARIGDARSAWETGVISRVNQAAYALGAREGQGARDWAELMAAVH